MLNIVSLRRASVTDVSMSTLDVFAESIRKGTNGFIALPGFRAGFEHVDDGLFYEVAINGKLIRQETIPANRLIVWLDDGVLRIGDTVVQFQ